MRTVRRVLFWTHLTAGVLGGVVILVMSFTGAALALRPQIQNWVDRDARIVMPVGARLSPTDLLARVQAARPEASPQSVALDADPTIAATVGLAGSGNVYVNPYSGAIQGVPSASLNSFFQSMTSWHRYMGASGEARDTGRAATGASNLAFLVLGLSGLYLWWPKQLTLRHLRPIVWFRQTSTSRARDFNWHNTIGFWCLIPIVVMTASGVVMSYTWGNNLVYRLTGSPIPQRGGPGAAGAPGGAPGGEGRGGRGGAAAMSTERGGAAGNSRAGGGERMAERRADGGAERGVGRRPEGGGERGARPEGGGRAEGERAPRRGGPGGEPSATVVPAALDLLFANAVAHVPTWGQLSMRLPNREGAPIQFTITDGAQWNKFARSQLTLNSVSGEVVQWQPYAAQSLGQKVRGWLRFAHTGELGGLPGQIVAGIGCLGGVVLVYTGLALACRRLVNWSLWARLGVAKRQRVAAQSVEDAVAQ